MKTDAEIDKFLSMLEQIASDISFAGEAAALIREQRAEIARLDGTSQMQQNFFNAAMDRANAAEQRIAELEQLLRDAFISRKNWRNDAKDALAPRKAAP